MGVYRKEVHTIFGYGIHKIETMGYGDYWVNFGESEVDEEARKEINEAFFVRI